MSGPAERARRLAAVLADVKFPAMKWEIVSHAEFVGADVRSRVELAELPAKRYLDLSGVLAAVDSRTAGDGRSPV